MAFVDNTYDLIQEQEMISHLRNINLAIQPRHRVQKVKTILEESPPDDFKKILEYIKRHGQSGFVFIKSVKICQMKD